MVISGTNKQNLSTACACVRVVRACVRTRECGKQILTLQPFVLDKEERKRERKMPIKRSNFSLIQI